MKSKLILFEGLPGSGKTTTARNIAAEIRNTGTFCQDFYEWSENHPIDIGDFDHVGEFIAAAGARGQEIVEQWRDFCWKQRDQDTVTVMESRFWQTTAMLMFAGGCPVERIIAHNQAVLAAISDLQPVLIYFTTGDVKAALERTIQIKNTQWVRDGREESWAERVFSILKTQKWFAGRDFQDLGEMSLFFEEWCVLAEELYARTPFRKMKIEDPYRDWNLTMQTIREFLDLPAVDQG